MCGKRLLLTGSTGGIGGAVKRAAEAGGWSVTTIDRGQFDAPQLDGIFDAVVFATGMCAVTPVTQLTPEKLMEAFTVNCGLFVTLTGRLVREKRLNVGAKILAVSSVSAVEGWAGGVAYCASKGALSAACRALAAELKPRGITVCALEPRYVKTRMFDTCAGRMGVSATLAQEPAELAQEILEKVQ